MQKFILCALAVITLAACKWECRLNNVQLISPSIPPAFYVGFFVLVLKIFSFEPQKHPNLHAN